MMFAAEVWGTVSDWVVAVTAVAGAGFGLLQLSAIRRADEAAAREVKAGREAQEATAKAHADWVQVQRAQFLMRLDDRFEGEAMSLSRRANGALRNRFEAEANVALPNRSNEARAEEAARRFSSHVTDLWRKTRTIDPGADLGEPKLEDDDAAIYARVMHLAYWIETVGFLVVKGMVAEDDIIRLYDQVVITMISNIRQHIADRADEGPYQNKAFLENAVWLCERAKVLKAEREMQARHGAAPSLSRS